MDGADLDLFERSLHAATDRSTGAALDAALDDLGWLDALAVDEHAAVSLLFGLQGAACASSSSLSRLLAFALCLDPAGAPVVLPAIGGATPPGLLEGTHVVVRGVAHAAVGAAGQLVVVAADGGSTVAATVATADLEVRPVHGIDPEAQLVEMSGRAAVVEKVTVDWGPALASAQVAIGHELVGASRQMLALAREHALEREQFGQPIAMFQAVRHRLAEAFIASETADAGLVAAWEDRSPTAAAMAKALAGRGARTAAKHCQQVLAGIGFTTEHDFHRYLRRTFVLDQLCGASKTLTRALGDDLLETRRLPALLPL
jgi:hypothetical protein